MKKRRPSPSPLLLAAALAALLAGACAGAQDGAQDDATGGAGPGDAARDVAGPPSDADAGAAAPSLAALLAAYEAGGLDRDELARDIRALAPPSPPAVLSGTVSDDVVLSAPGGSVRVEGETVVAADTALVLLGGARLALAADARLVVEGRLYALGTADAPVRIGGTADAPYDRLVLRGRSALQHAALAWGDVLVEVDEAGDAPIAITAAAFDHWTTLALRVTGSDGVVVRDTTFGLDTPAAEQEAETVGAARSALALERCTFGPRRGYRDVLDLEDCGAPPWPRIVGCRFLGGEDDAIDIDRCTAVIAGNHITDFWPDDPDAPHGGVNGGGITGDGEATAPLVVDNLVERCFHGVGFKNGARPVLLHNTIVGGHIGVTLYQGDAGRPQPHGVLVNNIVWGNRHRLTDAPQDVVLNGRWWPGYAQEPAVQATLEAHHNLFGHEVPGDDNRIADPALERSGDALVPAADSPAVDSGIGSGLAAPGFTTDELLAWLATDFRGRARQREGDHLVDADRGAVER